MLHSYLYDLIPHPTEWLEKIRKSFKIEFHSNAKIEIETRSFFPGDFRLYARILLLLMPSQCQSMKIQFSQITDLSLMMLSKSSLCICFLFLFLIFISIFFKFIFPSVLWKELKKDGIKIGNSIFKTSIYWSCFILESLLNWIGLEK